MRSFVSVLCVLGSVLADVTQLDSESFRHYIVDNKVILAFVAEWCGHCKALKPVLEEVSSDLENLGVKTATVDAIENSDLAAEYGVEGFPTVLYFSDGVHVKYRGDRSHSAIIDWVKKREEPASVAGSESDAIEASKSAGFVSFLGSFSDSTLQETFAGLAKIFRDDSVRFFSTTGKNFVKVFREGKEVAVLENADATKLKAFIDQERLPLFGEITAENYEAYETAATRSGVSFAWVCFSPENQDSEIKKYSSIFENQARKFRGVYNFVWLDTEKFGAETQEQIGCSTSVFPSLVIHKSADKPHQMQRYRIIDSEFDESKLSGFLTRVQRNEEPAFFRSKSQDTLDREQVIPEISANDLAKLTPTEIDTLLIITVSDRNMCPECISALDSSLILLAAAEKKFQVLSINGMENDPPAPEVAWDNVPYLLFFPRGQKSPKTFQGSEISPATLAVFIRENSDDNKLIGEGSIESIEQIEQLAESIKDEKLKKAVLKAVADFSAENEDFDDEFNHVETDEL